MTIKEIAKLAGVSTATVSRALNGQPGVLPEKTTIYFAIGQRFKLSAKCSC